MIYVAVIVALGLLVAYAFVVRPRLVRWGATDEEVQRPYPGAGIIPGGKRGTTMAVTSSRYWFGRTTSAPRSHRC